jgi:hypothetical protein
MTETELSVGFEVVLFATKMADYIEGRAASSSCVPNGMGHSYGANFKLRLINSVW